MSGEERDLFERMVDRVLSYKPTKVRKKQKRNTKKKAKPKKT
jgi:hypothetical protein